MIAFAVKITDINKRNNYNYNYSSINNKCFTLTNLFNYT